MSQDAEQPGRSSRGTPPGVCPHCDIPMEPGRLLQNFEVSWKSITWYSTEATLLRQIFNAKEAQVSALRCPSCGLLELYAPQQ